jgi:hypothetical protein
MAGEGSGGAAVQLCKQDLATLVSPSLILFEYTHYVLKIF